MNFKFHIDSLETFLAVNKYRVGSVAVAATCIALSMHFAERGIVAAQRAGK